MERQRFAVFCSILLLWSSMAVIASPADSRSAKPIVKEQATLTQGRIDCPSQS